MEYKELISNEYYSLPEIFATPSRKIIIPDFQRDYCWGDVTHGAPPYNDIVSSFLDTIIEEFRDNSVSDLLLGKIDVYEHPKNHIYLTDGQQRLTTLYLLVGMLYRAEKNDEIRIKLKNCLISTFEDEHDDQEPYLQYSVRESTVFFLKDLVANFFIDKLSIENYFLENGKIHKNKTIDETHLSLSIKRQGWYFSEYDLDPSIKSMLSALSIIEEKLKNIADGFSVFVLEKIKVQYYDVVDKQRGEERFVIINTTGKSLTLTENIKPILLGSCICPKHANDWEDRETFFWHQRDKLKESTADSGVNDFINWCFQIIDQQDEFDITKKAKRILKEKRNERYLEGIAFYYQALNELLSLLKNQEIQEQFKFINDNSEVKGILGLRALSKEKRQNILLPLLAFIKKFGMAKADVYKFLRRLRKNYFDQKWKERSINYVDWRYVLQIIEVSKSLEDVLLFKTTDSELKLIQNVKLNEWYTEEEKRKRKFLHNIELIEKWEDHDDFMGDLIPLFNVCDNTDDLTELEKYFNTYCNISPDSFTFSDSVKLKNIYHLFLYLNYGKFEHRSVAGQGYCMLINSAEKLFLQKDFNLIWKGFMAKTEVEMFDYLTSKIKKYFTETVLNGSELESVLQDTRVLGHYARVQLWSILEYLYAHEEINFGRNICQFWHYPNLIVISEDPENKPHDYSIDNLLLGTSYYNNKSGWIDFKYYPLMRELSTHRGDLSKIKLGKIARGEMLRTFLN